MSSGLEKLESLKSNICSLGRKIACNVRAEEHLARLRKTHLGSRLDKIALAFTDCASMSLEEEALRDVLSSHAEALIRCAELRLAAERAEYRVMLNALKDQLASIERAIDAVAGGGDLGEEGGGE